MMPHAALRTGLIFWKNKERVICFICPFLLQAIISTTAFGDASIALLLFVEEFCRFLRELRLGGPLRLPILYWMIQRNLTCIKHPQSFSRHRRSWNDWNTACSKQTILLSWLPLLSLDPLRVKLRRHSLQGELRRWSWSDHQTDVLFYHNFLH